MLHFSLVLAAFVGGCALQLQQAQLYQFVIYMAFAALAGKFIGFIAIKNIVMHRRRSKSPDAAPLSISTARRRVNFLMLLIAGLALGFGLTGARASWFATQVLQPQLEGRDIKITGVVANMPTRDESGLRFRFEVESAQLLQNEAEQAVSLPPVIQLAWYRSVPTLAEDAAVVAFAQLNAGSADLQAGERWQIVARLKAPHGSVNPHGFDLELWFWEQGIQATGYVRATPREIGRGDGPVKLATTWRHPIEAARQRVRDAMMQQVTNPQLAGVLAALVVGDQAAIERSDWDVFRATGVAHLMSISGLHITMFAWAAAIVVGSLWRRSVRLSISLPAQHAAMIGGVVLATAYALFAGWGLPAQRTVGMLAMVVMLRLAGKRWPWPMVWLAVCATIVALDPWALLSAGFWLSFVAVGILFASDVQGDGRKTDRANVGSDKHTIVYRMGHQLLPQVHRMLREQWVITLALAPLSVLLFNQISSVGLLANAIAIPWVTLLVTPLALLGIIFPALWQVAALAVQAMSVVLTEFAQWPFATISVATGAVFFPVIAMFGGFLMVLRLPGLLRLAGALMILPALLLEPERPTPGQFAMLAVDVGQGNAVLIQTAHHSLLYDSGARYSRESDAGQRTLVPLLRALGEKLDVLMISHRDADHIGGAAAVLKMQKEARLISSIEREHELQALRQSERCIAGQNWQWDGVRFDVLHPSASDYELANIQYVKPNAMSCVMRISNGRQTVLLTGDLEALQERRLVEQAIDLKADVLLVPHHGSKTSSTPEFLEAVKPQIAIVQAGYRNRFQHPVAEVMQRYSERGVMIIASPSCGAVRWSSDAAEHVGCQRDSARRYWHHRMDIEPRD